MTSDLSIKLGRVKQEFQAEARGLDKDRDGIITRSEYTNTSSNSFEEWVNLVKNPTEIEEVPTIQIPEMVAIKSRLSMSNTYITMDEIPAGLFSDVMKGYEFEGNNAREIKEYINNPLNRDKPMVFVNYKDAEEFARRFSEMTGRKFRLPTEQEWEAAKNDLKGKNWTWTSTESKAYKGAYYCRSLGSDYRASNDPEPRYISTALRLVEDK